MGSAVSVGTFMGLGVILALVFTAKKGDESMPELVYIDPNDPNRTSDGVWSLWECKHDQHIPTLHAVFGDTVPKYISPGRCQQVLLPLGAEDLINDEIAGFKKASETNDGEKSLDEETTCVKVNLLSQYGRDETVVVYGLHGLEEVGAVKCKVDDNALFSVTPEDAEKLDVLAGLAEQELAKQNGDMRMNKFPPPIAPEPRSESTEKLELPRDDNKDELSNNPEPGSAVSSVNVASESEMSDGFKAWAKKLDAQPVLESVDQRSDFIKARSESEASDDPSVYILKLQYYPKLKEDPEDDSVQALSERQIGPDPDVSPLELIVPNFPWTEDIPHSPAEAATAVLLASPEQLANTNIEAETASVDPWHWWYWFIDMLRAKNGEKNPKKADPDAKPPKMLVERSESLAYPSRLQIDASISVPLAACVAALAVGLLGVVGLIWAVVRLRKVRGRKRKHLKAVREQADTKTGPMMTV